MARHCPSGFNWGYGGSGPTQLALAILLQVTHRETARAHCQAFKWDAIARLLSTAAEMARTEAKSAEPGRAPEAA